MLEKEVLFRYYCLNRPPMPGTVPRGFANWHEFPERAFIPEVNHEAWGYVEYREPLSLRAVHDYELGVPRFDNSCGSDACGF